MTETGPTPDESLDFSSAPAAPSALTCAGCQRSIADQYWTVGTAVICRDCQAKFEAGQSPASGLLSRSGRFSRAVLYGFGGMLLGSTVWYLVMKLANLEIGLIAILLGWLVAKGILKGSGNRGGRRYQVLAVLLTYLGIGTAYLPFAVEGALQNRATEVTSADTNAVTPRSDSVLTVEEQAPTAAAAKASSGSGVGALLGAIALLLWGVLSLPVLTLSADAGAAISLLIYGFALMKAWQQTAERRLTISGPFQVGAAPAT